MEGVTGMKFCLMMMVIASTLTAPSLAEVGNLQPKLKPVPSYKLKYKELKQSLKLEVEELTPTEVLEVIAVRYAEMFDKAQENFIAIDNRLSALEIELANVKKSLGQTAMRVDKAEEAIKAQNDDLDKLFSWTSKIENELFDGVSYGAGQSIKSSVLQNARGVDDNASDVQKLKIELQNHARAINSLDAAVRSLK